MVPDSIRFRECESLKTALRAIGCVDSVGDSSDLFYAGGGPGSADLELLASATPEVPDRGVTGQIELIVDVSPWGTVANVTIKHSNLPEPYEQAAIVAAYKFRFKPGQSNYARCPTQILIPFTVGDDP